MPSVTIAVHARYQAKDSRLCSYSRVCVRVGVRIVDTLQLLQVAVGTLAAEFHFTDTFELLTRNEQNSGHVLYAMKTTRLKSNIEEST